MYTRIGFTFTYIYPSQFVMDTSRTNFCLAKYFEINLPTTKQDETQASGKKQLASASNTYDHAGIDLMGLYSWGMNRNEPQKYGQQKYLVKFIKKSL